MSDLADAHQGRYPAVRNQHGYDIGKSATCTCGWTSPDIHDSYPQAARAHLQHLLDAGIRPKERTA